MFWIVIDIMNEVVETGIIYFYILKMFGERLKRQKAEVIVSAVVFFALHAATSILITDTNPTLGFAITFLLIVVTERVLFEENLTKLVFLTILFPVLVLISESLLVGILNLMNAQNYQHMFQGSWWRIIALSGSRLLLFWLCDCTIRLFKKKSRDLPLKYWAIIILLPLFSIVILSSLVITSETLTRNIAVNLLSIVGVLLINLVMFNFFETYSKQLRLSVVERILERETENYKLLENSYNEMRQLKHDFNNQLKVVEDLILSHQVTSAVEQINNLTATINETSTVFYTGNPALDSIVNLKARLAWEKGIDFQTKLNLVAGELDFDSIEMCRIFGNALDNAIEACERCGRSERSICLSIQQIDHKLSIVIANTSNYVDVKDLNTEKRNKIAHGIGLQSINNSIEKLGGIVSYDYADGIFTLNLLIKKDKGTVLLS